MENKTGVSGKVFNASKKPFIFIFTELTLHILD